MNPSPPRLSPLAARLASERVLLTGATGFLGKAVLEKLLRATPGGAPIHVLVRARRGADARVRVRDLLASPLFDRAALVCGGREALEARVRVVEGDVGQDRMGLDEATYRALAADVTAVVNCSANCGFHEPLDVALESNTRGALRVLRFAQDAGDVPLVHVSTCYVWGDRTGDIDESPFPVGHTVRSWLEGEAPAYDTAAETARMLAEAAEVRAASADADPTADLVELGRRHARAGGWENVYLFTKALGEQLVVAERGRVPLAIVRPALIESTLAEPVPGWTDRMRISALMLECGRATLTAFAGAEDITIDLVPCDLVANAVLAALPAAGGGDADPRVLHVATSRVNPITLGEASRIVHDAFVRRPMRGPEGEPIQPSLVRWIPLDTFRAGLGREAVRLQRERERLAAEGDRRGARVASLTARRLAWLQDFTDTYAVFAREQPRFLMDRALEMHAASSPEDRALFPIDTGAFDWVSYLRDAQLPGLLRLQGIHAWRTAPVRERLRAAVERAASLGDVLAAAADAYGEEMALQVRREGAPEQAWVVHTFRELAADPAPLLAVLGGERADDADDAQLLVHLRHALANGAAVPPGGVLCLARDGEGRPERERLVEALATGACLTVID